VVAGYYGNLVDETTIRFGRLDGLSANSAIWCYHALGPSAINVVLAIIIAGAPNVPLGPQFNFGHQNARFCSRCRNAGRGPWYIMFVEILPNARPDYD
jgi:peptide/nickel transport system permease protein